MFNLIGLIYACNLQPVPIPASPAFLELTVHSLCSTEFVNRIYTLFMYFPLQFTIMIRARMFPTSVWFATLAAGHACILDHACP